MRVLVMGGVALVSYLFQSTLFEYIQIYNTKPNLIMITIISYALIGGSNQGAAYGLFAGLLLDIMSSKTLGIYSLVGMYLGLIVGKLNKNIYSENYLNVIVLTAAGTAAYNLLYYLFNISSNVTINLINFITLVFLPELIYNCVVSICVYYFILYLNKKMDYNKKIKSFKI